ncbi:bifunctional DNA-formamidopyrimidine glycosylase/DNA-(apurinic or apyrimidinic site) lyase [Novosphingobium sp.]|uniref:bifunctional DNA-formamidopyrimidine glycosylase/DNA-(apurinic or apyrimidinic site) lyase n=1 Tax=Novosphingobium sp. TaxID=1874826 RepID=UPI0025D2186C|nr:bifunctional DNA-formamidopyrimidine glycosylase/DNA-(apurinic or apyrimidinic site) lyase [Novosphingobium sp.]
MPELPEVETTVRGLERVLDGQTIARIATRRADLRRPFPENLIQTMTGATVIGLGRRAKYGMIHIDRGQSLIFHLGMSGRWRIEPDELGPHDHLVIETVAGQRLALCDPRRFGSVDLVDTCLLERWPSFAALGPEPLGDLLDVSHLVSALAGRSAAIKLMLLDQRIIAGLGNIYVCEALFRARINPRKAAGLVSRAALTRLVPAIKDVLAEAIQAGGSSLRDYARPDGELGYFSKRFDVYDRAGKPCIRDGAAIRRIVQGGRSTWFCGKCQK